VREPSLANGHAHHFGIVDVREYLDRVALSSSFPVPKLLPALVASLFFFIYAFLSLGILSDNAFFFLSPCVFSSGSHRVTRYELLQAQPRRVNRTRSRVDEDVVEEAAKRATKERCYHGYLDDDPVSSRTSLQYVEIVWTYSEVVPTHRPYFITIADGIRH
jgi:hypothetical protein